ncbi:hypothetical protein X768_32820 [Mesorhizobium sp. LSJC265A00]|nr:hypothetical protein X768_32820 [Mesorhizobium sp. LSJC265A00]
MTPVQVQKAMFLLEQEALPHIKTPFYTFVPYNYGPFCPDIYQDLKNMEFKGQVISDKTANIVIYSITKSGLDKADGIAKNVDPLVNTYTGQVVDWVKSQSFSGLLQAIYKKYPDYAVNSVFNK